MTQKRTTISDVLNGCSYLLVAITVLCSPWLFGAWERWWFWPFVAMISLSSACFGVRVCLYSLGKGSLSIPSRVEDPQSGVRPHLRLLLTFVPFLLYALVRAFQADVVMDAQRAYLLFLTPFLIGIQVVYGLSRRQRRVLLGFIVVDLVLLGLYGLINHKITGSQFVLWVDGYTNYTKDHRATGSYFCPDHFAGIMEIAFALAAAFAMSRKTGGPAKWMYGGVALLSLLCVALSKSRGGGLTLVVVVTAAIVWGFSQWPIEQAIWHRISAIAAMAIGLAVVWNLETSYMNRFKAYFVTAEQEQEMSLRERAVTLQDHLSRTPRGRMIAGAIRAWRSAPVFGIGPGMHQNRWPDFAASSDGNREEGIRPTMLNNTFHSYEVHSDWVQLLEELGAVGLALFLVPAAAVFGTFRRGVRRESDRWQRHRERQPRESDHATIFGGLLVLISMAFHSFGDFNLQMPATTWMFAAILALALAAALDQPPSMRRIRE